MGAGESLSPGGGKKGQGSSPPREQGGAVGRTEAPLGVAPAGRAQRDPSDHRGWESGSQQQRRQGPWGLHQKCLCGVGLRRCPPPLRSLGGPWGCHRQERLKRGHSAALHLALSLGSASSRLTASARPFPTQPLSLLPTLPARRAWPHHLACPAPWASSGWYRRLLWAWEHGAKPLHSTPGLH